MKAKNVYRAASALAAAAFVTGCVTPYSPTPVATNFRTSGQEVVQATAHWSAISRHIEKELGPALQNSPRRPLYVEPLQATPFNRAIASQLMTSLVNDGYVVSRTPDDALKVEIDTQVVEFSADRPQYQFSGERSALVSGVWVLTEVEHTALWLATAAIFAGDAYSWFHSQFASGATPKTEIMVNVAVSDHLRYYARYTSVYYTTDSDRSLYAVPAPPAEVQITKSFAVKGN